MVLVQGEAELVNSGADERLGGIFCGQTILGGLPSPVLGQLGSPPENIPGWAIRLLSLVSLGRFCPGLGGGLAKLFPWRSTGGSFQPRSVFPKYK